MEIKVYRMENFELKFASKEEEIKLLNDMCFKGKCEYLFTINNEKSLYFKISDLLYEIYSRKINEETELNQILLLFENIPLEYREKLKEYMSLVDIKDFYYNEVVKMQIEILKDVRETKETSKIKYLFRKIEDNSLVYSNNKEENGKLLAEFDLKKSIEQRALEVLNLIKVERISKNQLNKICKRLELDDTAKLLLRTINNSLLEKNNKNNCTNKSYDL